jgi:hypothetical protein
MALIELNPDELEKVAMLYDSIRALFKKVDPGYDKTLANDFDEHLKGVMESLSSSVKSSQPILKKNC